jgi:hypothetical protein
MFQGKEVIEDCYLKWMPAVYRRKQPELCELVSTLCQMVDPGRAIRHEERVFQMLRDRVMHVTRHWLSKQMPLLQALTQNQNQNIPTGVDSQEQNLHQGNQHRNKPTHDDFRLSQDSPPLCQDSPQDSQVDEISSSVGSELVASDPSQRTQDVLQTLLHSEGLTPEQRESQNAFLGLLQAGPPRPDLIAACAFYRVINYSENFADFKFITIIFSRQIGYQKLSPK